MDKHSKRSLPISHIRHAFTCFCRADVNLVTPDRAYSELENTTLSQRPSLSSVSADGLNKFFTAYTKYVKDQVAGRDNWVALQSTVETKVMQKEQSGGILLGKQHMMFPRTYGLVSSETRPAQEHAALKHSVSDTGSKVNVMLMLAPSVIYLSNVLRALRCWMRTVISTLLSRPYHPGRRRVALWTCGGPHRPQRRIYLLLHDHHWTSTGAYYAYKAL